MYRDLHLTEALALQKWNYNRQVKATNNKGQTQPIHQENRSGYMRNEIEVLPLKAERYEKVLFKALILFFLFSFFAISCSDANKKKESSTTATITKLKNYGADLTDASGSKVYYANCFICHFARYVQNQPALSEKAWLGIVTKMQKTFGAPIPDSSIEPIVKYLVAIKGKS